MAFSWSSSKRKTKTHDYTKSKLEKHRQLIYQQAATYKESLSTERARRQTLVKEVIKIIMVSIMPNEKFKQGISKLKKEAAQKLQALTPF